MRRATVLAFIMVMALSGIALAKPPVAMVTGTYTYLAGENPEQWRTVALNARATDPAMGTWSWTTPAGTMSGPVTCLRVDGADAWLAGPVTSGNLGTPAVFMWIHDGGNPAANADTAFTWGADPGETLADMEALCASMTTSPYGFDPFALVSGNLIVHRSR
jgi:hypothetical protein